MAKNLRTFVEKFGVKNYFPVGRHGISHVLVAQEGIALPGKILANADSHTCSSGALNCLARGMGPSEMLLIICKGQTWFLTGPTTSIMIEGELPERVLRGDVIHYIPGEHGDFAGRNLEWHGDGLANIDMDGRLTMATISAGSPLNSPSSPSTASSSTTSKAGPRGPSSRSFPTTTPSTTRSSRSTSRRSSHRSSSRTRSPTT